MTRTLNLGILAHVDAGKTSLTERLLFDTGATNHLGSVDGGDTQTDSSEVERRRGITVRSAVASFALGDLQVNLVDTPGHPDFIAEVERALHVLDGAVLVLSAVEGVQAQTRVLMRSLRNLHLPTLLFVNKVDRMGARYAGLIKEIRHRLGLSLVPMQTVTDLGTRMAAAVDRGMDDTVFRTELAESTADHDDALLARLVDGVEPSARELRSAIRRQVAAGVFHPVYFGSAISGAGAAQLLDGVREYLRPPGSDGGSGRPARGTVFAVERTGRREKVAYLRLWSGSLHTRQRVTFHRRTAGGVDEEYAARIAQLEVVGPGGSHPGPPAPGDIAKLRGVSQVRVGDELGEPVGAGRTFHFSPPILESIVRPQNPDEQTALHAALTQLSDEDPLIRIRGLAGGETSVFLYGAVQREVITERLATEFGIAATFEQVKPVYFERPRACGNALHEFDRRTPNEFYQTVGLRVEPAPAGTGNRLRREVEWGLLPRGYHQAIADAVFATLGQGLHGWEVVDCTVTVTKVDYEAPMSSAADFRHLTPMVLMRALQDAGVQVYEPTYAVEVEAPADTLSGVIGLLSSLGADIGQAAERSAGSWTVPGKIPARLLQQLVVALPGLTRGDGAILYEPGGDRRVRGTAPTRRRTDGNPLDHDEYMRFLSRGAPASATRV